MYRRNLTDRRRVIQSKLDEIAKRKADLENQLRYIEREEEERQRLDAEREPEWVAIMVDDEAADRFVQSHSKRFIPWTRSENYEGYDRGYGLYWPPDTPLWVRGDPRRPTIMHACRGAVINEAGSDYFRNVILRYLRRRRYTESDPSKIRQFIRELIDRLQHNWITKRKDVWNSDVSGQRVHHLHANARELYCSDYVYYKGIKHDRSDVKIIKEEVPFIVAPPKRRNRRSDRLIADAVRNLGLIVEKEE